MEAQSDMSSHGKSQNLSSENPVPPESVRFVGVLGLGETLRDASTPEDFRSHPLVQGRFFYTIPNELLQAVCRPQAGESFDTDAQLLEMEESLARISGNHGAQVGFWNDMPIDCSLMRASPLVKEDLAQFGLTDETMRETLQKANERLLSFSEITCGYAGWLMANPTYRSELAELESTHADALQRWGTRSVGLFRTNIESVEISGHQSKTGWQEYESAVLEFCVRWRLQGLAGPRIPLPMRPMVSGQFPLSVLRQLMRAGGVFNWPDTFPLYARDELRDLLADALQSSAPAEHLTGWHNIIDADNKAKNQFAGFERRFRLQHSWRLLRERHPSVFAKRIQRIERAFAEYLGVEEASVHRDLGMIKSALGSDWDQSHVAD